MARAGKPFLGVASDVLDAGVDPTAAANAYVASMDEWQDEVERTFDAFLLDPGMGPMTYLASDGRILRDNRGWDGDTIDEEESEDSALEMIVIGARKTGVSELLRLLPAPIPASRKCPGCRGARYREPSREGLTWFVCSVCSGRGWATQAMIEAQALHLR